MAGLREAGIIVSAVSTYRAIERLHQHGAIERVQMLSAFRILDRTEAMLLVCTSCGRTESVAVPEQRHSLLDALSPSGFVPSSVAIEVGGRCAECAAEQDRN